MAALRTREPNGRPQREPQNSASEVRRLREMAWRGLRDAEWGSELGRLYLEKMITATMYAAGKRFARELETYHRTIGVFPVRTIAMEHNRSTPADPDTEAGKKIARRESDAAEAFMEAEAILMAAGAEKAVRHLLVTDNALCGWGELLIVRSGLSQLAKYYALTEIRKSPQNVRSIP